MQMELFGKAIPVLQVATKMVAFATRNLILAQKLIVFHIFSTEKIQAGDHSVF